MTQIDTLIRGRTFRRTNECTESYPRKSGMAAVSLARTTAQLAEVWRCSAH